MNNENDQLEPFISSKAKKKQEFQSFHNRALLQNCLTSLVSFECILILLIQYYCWRDSFPSKGWINGAYFICIIASFAVRVWFIIFRARTKQDKSHFTHDQNFRFISLASFMIIANYTLKGNEMPIEKGFQDILIDSFYLVFQLFLVCHHIFYMIDMRKLIGINKSKNVFCSIISVLIFIQIARYIFFPSTLEATFVELILGYAAGGALCVFLERREATKKPKFHAWLEYSQSLRFVCLPLYFETPAAFILFILLQNVCLVVLNKKRMKSQTFDLQCGDNFRRALRFSQNTISQDLSFYSQNLQRVALLQKEQIKLADEYCSKCIGNRADIILSCKHCFLCTKCARKEIQKSEILYKMDRMVYCSFCKYFRSICLRALVDYFSDFWLKQSQGSNGNFRSKVYIIQQCRNLENNSDDDE